MQSTAPTCPYFQIRQKVFSTSLQLNPERPTVQPTGSRDFFFSLLLFLFIATPDAAIRPNKNRNLIVIVSLRRCVLFRLTEAVHDVKRARQSSMILLFFIWRFFYALEYIIGTFSRTASQTNRRWMSIHKINKYVLRISERRHRTKYKLLTDGLSLKLGCALSPVSPRSPGAKGLVCTLQGLRGKIMINKVHAHHHRLHSASPTGAN